MKNALCLMVFLLWISHSVNAQDLNFTNNKTTTDQIKKPVNSTAETYINKSRSTLVDTPLNEDLKSLLVAPMVVTATKFPTQMDKTGNTIRVITKQELTKLGVSSVTEALGLISNVSISQSGGLDTVFMRGMHSGSTKILLNGIELNDPISTNGQPMIGSIAFSTIDQIEVVSGAKGTIYGAASQAGVINIITSTTTPVNSINAEYAGANYKLNGGLSTQINEFNIFINSTYETENSDSLLVNTSEIDKRNLQSIALSVNKPLINNSKLSTFYTYNNLHQDLDNSTTDDKNYVNETTQHLGTIQYDWKLKSNVLFKIGYTKTITQRDYTNTPDSQSDVVSRDARYKSNIDKVFINSKYAVNAQNNIVFGLDIVNETGEFVDNGSSAWGAYSSNQGNSDQSRAGVFSQYNNENKVVSAQLGSRLERYGNKKTILTYALSLYRDISIINTTALINFRTGYRAGSLYERFNSVDGNNELEAETSLAIEYGLLKKFKYANIKLGYFKNYIDNSIEYDNKSTFKYYNLKDETHTAGFELSVQGFSYKNLEFIRIDLASLEAKDADGNKLLRRPEYKASVSTALTFKSITAGVSFIATGDRVDLEPGTYPQVNVNMPSFAYVNLKLNYELQNKSNIYVKIYNFTNTQYEVTKGYNGRNRQIYLGYERKF